jgi:hypothetical protein
MTWTVHSPARKKARSQARPGSGRHAYQPHRRVADTAHSTVLHIPSLAAVVTGDLAYNQVHMMSAETGQPERAQWIANLDAVAELEPTLVVAGHKKVDSGNDPKIICESQQYLRDFSRIAAEETTTAGIVTRMTERYPDWENLRTLWHSARTAIARNKG